MVCCIIRYWIITREENGSFILCLGVGNNIESAGTMIYESDKWYVAVALIERFH